MRDVPLGELSDLYVYCVLVIYPDRSLDAAYHGFAEYLVRNGIRPQYENFLTLPCRKSGKGSEKGRARGTAFRHRHTDVAKKICILKERNLLCYIHAFIATKKPPVNKVVRTEKNTYSTGKTV